MGEKITSMLDWKANRENIRKDEDTPVINKTEIEAIVKKPGYIANEEYEKFLLYSFEYCKGQMLAINEFITTHGIQNEAMVKTVRNVFIQYETIRREAMRYLECGMVEETEFTNA